MVKKEEADLCKPEEDENRSMHLIQGYLDGATLKLGLPRIFFPFRHVGRIEINIPFGFSYKPVLVLFIWNLRYYNWSIISKLFAGEHRRERLRNDNETKSILQMELTLDIINYPTVNG